ncbi:MAG: gliding motility-associated C-terminal domain-containing protein [Lewinellaceae bacterium]|nr:gliding motility-associated C-terminal domain-containing protein [Lewinellaceae bacterium]
MKTPFSAFFGPVFLLFSTFLQAQQPANDLCANASVIAISGAGYDYGIFTSGTADLANATGESGEYFYFALQGHVKSVWYEFTLTTRRNLKVEMSGAGLANAAITLYRPSNCLPGQSSLSGALNGDAGGFIENACSEYGTYRIQVTAPASLNASVVIKITLGCPSHLTDSKYDCPANAFAFNADNPLPQSSSSTGIHTIGCQSLDDTTEYACLPLPDKTEYRQSTWYVFKTGSKVDLLSFNCYLGSSGGKLGYRLLQGDVRPAGPAGLPQIACGLAKEDSYTRYIEFPCQLLPNTTYSIALYFHKDYMYTNFNLIARQRSETATGWPKPVQAPVAAANQLGALPDGGPTKWFDQFDCSAFISQNPCPPANPASGTVVIGTGNNAKTFDLATWATFTLSSDANVEFQYYNYNYYNAFHTRIFRKTLGNSCPSPDPATDLIYEFSGINGSADCLPQGDYSIQVLSSSVYPFQSATGFWNDWTYGNLGTDFEFRFNVQYLPANGLFMLDTPGAFDSINMFNPLQNNVLYNSTPAVFVCNNTVLPANGVCSGDTKAMYREFKLDEDGLLCMMNLRTDDYPDPPVHYELFQADANANANAQNTHNAGQTITGMTDYLGVCIDYDDNTYTPAGIDTFCTCATAGTYTLVSLGDSTNPGKGDAPKFRFKTLKTIHDSRANAETVALGPVPGAYTSQPDVFSCADNLGAMPPCGNRKKLIFRQFYLPSPAVVSISETGNNSSVLSLFQGQATDAASALALVTPGCFTTYEFTDECTPLDAGWYTVVSYGAGPNYTDKRIWNNLGNAADVGKTSKISISLAPAIIPNYNRPNKAYQAGTTDWTPLPPANPNAITGKLYTLGTEHFCAPDTPFISNSILPCAAGFNRIAFYVFTITKNSFVQIRGVDQGFYVEVFPFNVTASPASLLSVPPVYQCLSIEKDYRQICDLPPGTYTIAIFAANVHKGTSLTPSLYVEAVGASRFDDASDAYSFDLIQPGGIWQNGKTGDVNPVFPAEAPSRDVFYCTTGARATDPADTRCGTQLNPLIYAPGPPNPLFLPGNPAAPVSQPWRTLWYTFELEGSGTASITANILTSGTARPLMAVYESNLDATQPWSVLKNLGDGALSAGLTLLDENVDYWCDADYQFSGVDLSFPKNGCIKNRVRYFLVVSFDADEPNFPDQAISISIKYDGSPIYPADYDESTTANVLNGLGQTQPPYTTAPLTPGNTFTGPDFSLLCYTKNPADPTTGFCGNGGESAWFKFEVTTTGQFYAALQKVGGASGWFTSQSDLTVWREATPGGPLTQLPLSYEYVFADQHEWLSGCIGPGVYYLLVRSCSSINELQPYRAVIRLTDSPGDFCTNAIPLDVTNFLPSSATATVDCHTIGTDFGETTAAGMGCLFGPAGKKTSWFRVHVAAGAKVDLNFKLTENLSDGNITLNHLAYRVFSGSCGALTPVVCSALGSNSITQNCLGPGDYYIQVAMPEKVGNTAVEGAITLTVTASPNTDSNCIPANPNAPLANFDYSVDCQFINFANSSTAGTDISYQWLLPDGTNSALAVPAWTPPGAGVYPVTLTVTNTANGLTATLTKNVTVNAPFANYQPLADGVLCNGIGSVVLDATVPGSTYLWSDNSSAATLTTNTAGIFEVLITNGGCEKRDTAIVTAVNAQGAIVKTICPGDTITIGGTVFHQAHSSGMVTLPAAHPSGCDSILNVSVGFYPPAIQYFDTTLCSNLSFTLGGQTFSAANPSGQVTLPQQAQHGCDLLLNVEAQFTQPVNLSIQKTLCSGQIFAYGGSVFSETNPAATVLLPVSVPGGCDTLVDVNVSFYRPDTAQLAVQRCANQIFTFEGYTFTPQNPDGFVTLPGAAMLGCDSVVQVQVAFLPTIQASVQPVLCAGNSIVIQGQTCSENNPSGVILLPGSGAGCDTVLNVSVQVLPKIETWLTPDICPGGSVQVGNDIFDENNPSGSVLLKAVNNCDSTVHVNITPLPPATGAISGTYCHGDTAVIFGQIFTATHPGDVVVQPGVAPNGCDSIWTVDLFFKSLQTTSADQTACLGTSLPLNAPPGGTTYSWQDGSTQPVFTAAQDGVYWVQTIDAEGCTIRQDSFVVQFGALAQPAVAGISTCAGEHAVFSAGGSSGQFQWYDAPTGGNLLFTGSVFDAGVLTADSIFWVEAFQANAPGCVSARVPVSAEVHPQILNNVDATLCASEHYVFGSQNLSQSGIYEQTWTSVYGCDSTVTLTLTVLDTFFQKISAVICHNGSYQLPDGQVISQAGIFSGKLTAQNGCDSTWEVSVTQKMLITKTESASICNGSNLLLPWGETVAVPGTYIRLFPYSSGCDSLEWVVNVQAAVPVQPGLAAQSDFNGFAISCSGASDGQAGISPAGGTPPYTMLWNTGNTETQLSGLATGTYTVTLTDAAGCIAQEAVTLMAPPVLNLMTQTVSPVCPDNKQGSVEAEVAGGAGPYLFALDGGVFTQNAVFQNIGPGTYSLTVQDANGCEATSTAIIDEPVDFSVGFDPAELKIHFGDSLQLLPEVDFVPDSVSWQPATTSLSCADCLEPWAKPFHSTVYELTVWNAAGCSATATLRVQVDQSTRIFIPTIFSPNDDGQNDYFRVFAGPELKVVRRLAVFNRWGESVFEARDFLPDSTKGAWDGKARGKDLNPGVFVWVCVVELSDGRVETLEGDVTLVR